MADKTIAFSVELKGTEVQKKKLAGLETEVKKLTLQRTKLNKQLKDGTINTKQYGSAIAKVNTGLKAHRRELLVTRQEMLGIDGFTTRLGKSFRKMGTSIVAGFAGMFAIQKIGQLFSNATKIFKDFEQANANLASVLGTTVDKIATLTEDAKRLGAATAFSATEVAKLQTEFAKLGFTEEQILNATEATLDLAAATGSDLAQAAAIAGATLGGFGLEAKETQKLVDVMAKSFSTSALDIEKFRESMKFAAPAAKAVGVSVEETTALLGTLANAGISGSLAGTGLAKTFTMLNKEGLTLQEGLEQVANSQNKLQTATELVGQTAAKSFLVLAEGTETTKALKKGLENAGGAAKRMADTQLDTLEGKTKILNSAFEGLVLSLTSGDSAFNSIAKGIVEATTSLLGFLTVSEDANQVSFESAKANRDLADSSQLLLDEYESLVKDGIEPTTEEKEKLDLITLQLKFRLGESVVAINQETGALTLNTEAVRQQIKLKRFASDQEAATLASRLKGIQDEIKLQELSSAQNEKEAQKRTEIQKASRQRVADLEREERFNLSASESLKKARIEEEQAQERFIQFAKKRTETSQSLIKNQAEEADLIAKLKELNFSAADAEALFTVEKRNSIKASNEQVKAISNVKFALEELDEVDDDDDFILDEEEVNKSTNALLNMADSLEKATDKAQKLKEQQADIDAKKLVDETEEKNDLDLSFQRELDSQKIALAEQTANALVDVAGRKAEREKDLELAALDAKLQSGLISQEEFEKQKEAIERKAFNQQKRLELAQIAISLATEIANIAANSAGNPLNAFTFGTAGAAQNTALAGIAIARSAIQAGIVASQKFDEGGYTGSGFGSPDSSGFKQAGVVHEGEYVVPKNVLESQRGGTLVSALESMRTNRPQPFSSYGFANGGLVGSGGIDISNLENKISSAVANSIGAIQVVNNATDTISQAAKVSNIQSEATFG